MYNLERMGLNFKRQLRRAVVGSDVILVGSGQEHTSIISACEKATADVVMTESIEETCSTYESTASSTLDKRLLIATIVGTKNCGRRAKAIPINKLNWLSGR